jgi:hypothetical protein
MFSYFIQETLPYQNMRVLAIASWWKFGRVFCGRLVKFVDGFTKAMRVHGEVPIEE